MIPNLKDKNYPYTIWSHPFFILLTSENGSISIEESQQKHRNPSFFICQPLKVRGRIESESYVGRLNAFKWDSSWIAIASFWLDHSLLSDGGLEKEKSSLSEDEKEHRLGQLDSDDGKE